MVDHEIPLHSRTENRPDEWRIAQGLAGAVLPGLDMTGPETVAIPPREGFNELTKAEAALEALGDYSAQFTRERKGWKGLAYYFP
jgi:sulfite oxidase